MRFKDVINKYGVTQQDLANRMGMNRVSVSRLLSEKNDLRISTIEKIANAIGCPISELFQDAKRQKSSDFFAFFKHGESCQYTSSMNEAEEILNKIKEKTSQTKTI